MEITLSSDGTSMEIVYAPPEPVPYKHIWFPTWSRENDQDDLIWYSAALHEDGTWRLRVDPSSHTLDGEIYIHVYGGDASPTDFLAKATVVVG